MKQEEKDLLLRDLCGRLPYYTLVYLSNPSIGFDSKLSTTEIEFLINDEYIVKPYLFPPQSLSQAQKDEICKAADGMEYGSCAERWDAMIKVVDLVNKYNVDYRDLIPNGLAIDATGLNLY